MRTKISVSERDKSPKHGSGKYSSGTVTCPIIPGYLSGFDEDAAEELIEISP